MKRFWFSFLVIFIMSTVVSVDPVQADVAPPPVISLGGIEPFGYQNTEVQMMYERVELELQLLPQDPEKNEYLFHHQVLVKAWFMMHNHGNQDEEMKVFFPIENLLATGCRLDIPISSYNDLIMNRDSFSVLIDGKPVDTDIMVTKHPYDNGDYCYQDTFSWKAFDVNFPAGENTLLRIEYILEVWGNDSVEDVQYILETGAGWKGTIKEGYVVFRFPNLVDEEQILSSTTPGYKVMYNQIYWHFKNLEPSRDNNIQIAFISPQEWVDIQYLGENVQDNPEDIDSWINLMWKYARVSVTHGSIIRDFENYKKIYETFQQAVKLNPHSPDLYLEYGDFYFNSNLGLKEVHKDVLVLIDQALKIDPENERALDFLKMLDSDMLKDYTRPPTFTATFGPTPTATITKTPHPTRILSPTSKLNVQELSSQNTPHSVITDNHLTTVIPSPVVTPTQFNPAEEKQISQDLLLFIIAALILVIGGTGLIILFGKGRD